MRGKLEELGLRQEYNEERELHGGLKSKVFWDIQRLFDYPFWIRVNAIADFIWEVGRYKPELLTGIRKGGYLLAGDMAPCLDIVFRDEGATHLPFISDRTILVDDVLTTGATIKNAMETIYKYHALKPAQIAVLINRSSLDEIEGIPIISGIKCDHLADQKEGNDEIAKNTTSWTSDSLSRPRNPRRTATTP